jgi:hypothetical protein
VSSRADDSVVRVRWVAPLDCPRGDFDRELSRLLGADPPEASAEVDVSTLADGPRRYQLSLQLTAAAHQGKRELDLASCADVRHAAALLIATALQEEASAAHATRGSGWRMQLAALGDAFSLPGLSGGPELGIAWYSGGLRVSLDARYLLARQASDDDSALRADFDLFAGSLGAAYLRPVGPFGLGPSVGLELGWLRGRSTGEQASDGGSLWASALVGGRAELPVSDRFGLLLGAQLSVPMRRTSFSLAGESPFYQTRPVGLRLTIGINIGFGDKRSDGDGQ